MKNLNFKDKKYNFELNNMGNHQKLSDKIFFKRKNSYSDKENIEDVTDIGLSNKLSEMKDVNIKNSFFAKNFEDSGEENISSSETNHNLQFIQNKFFKK